MTLISSGQARGSAQTAQIVNPRLAGAGLLIAVCVVAAVFAPAMFTLRSLQNMAIQLAPLAIVALGQTFVILVRGLDLSVASVMATAAVIAASFGSEPGSAGYVLLYVGLTAGAVGLVNGLLVTKRNLEPFLCTLATMIVLQGIRSAITRGAPLGDTPAFVRYLGRGMIGSIPVSALGLLLIVAIAVFVLRRTIFGRWIYLVGSNNRAAALAGIPTDAVTIACYVISSMLAGLAGIVMAGYLDQVDNWVGRGFELDSIVAAVMGGVSLAGGAGGALGSLGGAAILVAMSNFIAQLGIPVQFQLIMKGLIVIVAVSLYARRAAR